MNGEQGGQPPVSLAPPTGQPDGPKRLGVYELVSLAAGGVIGSGWLVGASQTDALAGIWAFISWLVGGALMAVIAVVMVRLSTVAPKSGGLVFLPVQSSGPLLATVAAAGLWIFYAVNPASEATAIVRSIWQWNPKMYASLMAHGQLTWTGVGWAVLVMFVVTAVNLLGQRLFILINIGLTAFKIFVPFLVIVVLVAGAIVDPPAPVHFHPVWSQTPYQFNLVTVLSTVTGGSVIYAYLGFQGPLDFAGSVRRDGIGEAARLRRAVYITIVGSICIYVVLQLVITYYHFFLNQNGIDASSTPYLGLVESVTSGPVRWLVMWLLRIDMVLSPAGAAMVFTFVLTREVAALSRAHLTHRGLQRPRYSFLPVPEWLRSRLPDAAREFLGEQLDVYWLILGIDFLISTAALVIAKGLWSNLSPIASVLALIVYAIPSVVLAARRRWKRPPIAVTLRRPVLFEAAAFALIAVIFYLAGWPRLEPAMIAMVVGSVLLFVLPYLFSLRYLFSRPRVVVRSRLYDSRAYAGEFLHPRSSPSARSAIVLSAFFALLTLLAFATNEISPKSPYHLYIAIPVAAVAVGVYFRLAKLAERHMAKDKPPPVFPDPFRD